MMLSARRAGQPLIRSGARRRAASAGAPPRAIGGSDADAERPPNAPAAAADDKPSGGDTHPTASNTDTNNSNTTPHFARLVEAPPSGAPGPAGQQPRSAAVPLPSTPPELEGLRLTADGDLVDAATGRPLPGLGEPSRFDIACAALRGDLDPPAWRPDTERAPAALVAALLGPFPLDYEFNAVGRIGHGQTARQLADELAAVVHAAAACTGPVPRTTTAAAEEEEEAAAAAAANGGAATGAGAGAAAPAPAAGGGSVTFKERMGGKYASVCVRVRVRSADLMEEGFAALAKDERVVMRY